MAADNDKNIVKYRRHRHQPHIDTGGFPQRPSREVMKARVDHIETRLSSRDMAELAVGLRHALHDIGLEFTIAKSNGLVNRAIEYHCLNCTDDGWKEVKKLKPAALREHIEQFIDALPKDEMFLRMLVPGGRFDPAGPGGRSA